MKYFTLDWWMGQREGDAAKDYRAYLEDVKDLLPVGVLQFEERVSIHDGKLLRLDTDVAAGTVLIVLDGFDWNHGHFPLPQRTITLKYNGVTSVRSIADPQHGLPGPHGYGDLGYWEFEAMGDGLCEHRILFSTGIELHIRFREMAVA